MGMPELKHDDPVQALGRRLVAVDDLPPSGVTEVRTQEHGVLAVGIAGGTPFAVSNVCRHQFAKLGQGQVREGCLECPWHRARYDVTTGEMISGPKGRVWGFPPYSAAVRTFGSKVAPLRRFDVELRDGAIWLA
jgi:3-phenylpropionate/trans-cinnamate dioxygenase ferredoxin component